MTTVQLSLFPQTKQNRHNSYDIVVTVVVVWNVCTQVFPVGLFFAEHRSNQRGIFRCPDGSDDSGGKCSYFTD